MTENSHFVVAIPGQTNHPNQVSDTASGNFTNLYYHLRGKKGDI